MEKRSIVHIINVVLYFLIIELSKQGAYGQEMVIQNIPDTLVLYHGRIVNINTKAPITNAKIKYEKLPYMDDIGFSRSKGDSGIYSLSLRKDQKYNVEIEADGYLKIYRIITASYNVNLEHIEDFELTPNRIGQLLRLTNIRFKANHYDILPSSYYELDGVVKMMKEYKNMVIQLEGHTDIGGNIEAQLTLSDDRVNAVKKYLAEHGISRKRIKTKAFGGTKPISKEYTQESKAMNRRVEARILQN